MNLIACIILAPILGFTARSRRMALAIMVAVFALTLAPTAHMVLLQDQVEQRSWANTMSFFAVNYVVLIVAAAGADWIWRRRHQTARTSVAAGAVQ